MIGAFARFGATALIAGVVLSGTAHAVCMPKTFGSGTGANAGIATNQAIQNWRVHVLGAYGVAFTNWLKAQNRGRRCYTSGAVTTCRVWGNPCN
jgi:hypothetical protein